jgi:zinc transport system substrate-binding protein
LINTIKTENLPAVFTIELSNRRIAKTISESAGVKVLELNAAHNLTQEQFNAQMTYVDTLYANAKALDAGLR